MKDAMKVGNYLGSMTMARLKEYSMPALELAQTKVFVTE